MLIDGRYGDNRPLKIFGRDAAGDRRFTTESSGYLYFKPEPTPEIDIEKLARDKLRSDHGKYHDFLMHLYWDVHNLKSLGVPEPPKGCGKCKDASDEYLSSLTKTNERNIISDIEKAQYLNVFDINRFMKPAKLDGFSTGDKLG